MTVTYGPLRWWQLPPVLALERALFAPDAWSAEQFWSELAQHGTRLYLAGWDGSSLLGYAGLATYRDEASVQTLAVAPERQREGWGAALLARLLAAAAQQGAGSVSLEVRADNEGAQRLYGRTGFVVVGRRRGYYQPSGVDALVMRAGLRPPEPGVGP